MIGDVGTASEPHAAGGPAVGCRVVESERWLQGPRAQCGVQRSGLLVGSPQQVRNKLHRVLFVDSLCFHSDTGVVMVNRSQVGRGAACSGPGLPARHGGRQR